MASLRIWHSLQPRARSLLMALLLAAASLFGFLKLGSEVMEGDTMALDRAILRGLRSADPAIPIGPPWLTEAMTNVTALGSTTVLLLVSIAAACYLLLAGARRLALFLALSVGGGLVMGALLKLAYQRPRPDIVPHLVHVATTSFPSGHAVDSAIVYLTLASLAGRRLPRRALRLYLLAVAIMLSLLIGASRIFLGVHWPSDVAAGWTVGATWALLCSWAYRHWDGDAEGPANLVDAPGLEPGTR